MDALEIEQQVNSFPEQKIGSDRLGPTDAFEALGPTFILATGMLLLISILLILYIILKRKFKIN